MIARPEALSGGVGNNHNLSSRGRKMRVLVGDIGGTKTGLAVAETIGGKVQLDHERRYPSRDYASLDALLRRYCDDTGAHCDLAALAIAGPVQDGCSKTTNLPWEIDAGEIRQGLGFSAVRLLNDLEAPSPGGSLPWEQTRSLSSTLATRMQ
jgi:glucokinase